MTTTRTKWQFEKEQLLRELWPTLTPMTVLCRQLGQTRVAIQSKARRMRLPPRPSTTARQPPRNVQKIVFPDAHRCRWPEGDPRQPDFHFCGARATANEPYCGSHALKAYIRR